MTRQEGTKGSLHTIASEFFAYLGKHLPQQCANDEFYFLPRSEVAIEHLDHLDDLRPDRIQDHIRYVRNLLNQIPLESQETLEEETDRLFLKQSMESFIREFHDMEVWRNDPTLYVKIPLFATEQIISQKNKSPEQMISEFAKLFTQIPPFLSLATKNLNTPSEISLYVAARMAGDAIRFYQVEITAFIEEKIGPAEVLLKKNRRVLEAWGNYSKTLSQGSSKRTFAIGEEALKDIFFVSLSYNRTPAEILDIAQEANKRLEEKIRQCAEKIERGKSWKRIIDDGRPSEMSSGELMQQYEMEVQNLRRFFYSEDIMSFPKGEKIDVLQTPTYLKSLRATASYKAPLTGIKNGMGIFYITPGTEDLELISTHCPYLTAHETYPGHHVLDHIRIHHPNPIRRQIESPLFYEGWACYSEQLLDELGYVKDPRQQLILLKRQLWRNLRAVLDVKLQTGRMNLGQAAEEIQRLGFSPKRAERQVRRFCLTPGYQSCYFLGAQEIVKLRERYASSLSPKIFHDTLLGGGEIPFHLVEKRLQTLSPTHRISETPGDFNDK